MNALKRFTNEGSLDRVLRVLLGAVLLSLVFVGPQTVWGMLGLIPLVTGIFGFCPIYKLVGINTCQKGDCAQEA